jgi:hypothetical protein
MSVMML